MRRKVSTIAQTVFLTLLLALFGFGLAQPAFAKEASPPGQFVFARDGRKIVVEPYAPNILRVTLSSRSANALGLPGYGIIGTASARGWTQETDADGYAVLRSARMVLRLAPEALSTTRAMPLDPLNQSLRDIYFGGGTRSGQFNDMLSIETASGKRLLAMQRWSMTSNAPGAAPSAEATPATDPGSRVSATFAAPADEHFFGLGQQQQGLLDLRGHEIHCWHDYGAIGGENVCVPFLVSTRGYGLIWDNPSKTTVDLAINQQSIWSSEVGDRVSFFVIVGENSDEIYQGYRELTGATPLLPRGSYGYIQSKAIYPTQKQALAVAKGYRDRKLPLDTLVVDFLNMTRQGELDLDPARWPDPAGMNRDLHAMGVRTLLSVWPHFAPGTRYYDMLLQRGWLIRDTNGVPDQGTYKKDVFGPNIDTTNPAAARWWWEAIRDRYIKPYGFDDIWLDETEPDVDPVNDVFSIGSGKRYYNVYPLFHTASIYDGIRRDYGDTRRILILARAAYLGAQRNGTVFWSSDIVSSWDMLKRSIPTGLNFAASGMAYWDTDIAGFFSPSLPATYRPEHPPLIDPKDARDNIDRYTDYPELFVRWFQWGTFQPVMRAHGERMHNEVWSYGKQAEPILSAFLRLRYQLLPYTYSLGYRTYLTGAPFMRALFMDFPGDPNALDLKDEYMFGPAFLVAPVTEQGATSRKVYLPAGTDWYNYWTNERVSGGRWVEVAAPIDIIPLFVRAGSIVPMGSAVPGASKDHLIESVRVYRGADAQFTLFSDDGTSYRYEQGAGSATTLRWDDRSGKLTYSVAPLSSKRPILQIIGH